MGDGRPDLPIHCGPGSDRLMTQEDKNSVAEIMDDITALLRGELPPRRESSDGSSKELRELRVLVSKLIDANSAAQTFISALSQGNLDVFPPPHNYLISPFKQLHANLRHLVWQTKQVAAGDLNQRVDFLGEFSIAFNSMIEALWTKESLRESKHQYDRLVSKISVGIYILHSKSDGALIFNYVSPKMAEILNVSAESLMVDSLNFIQTIHPDDLDSFLKLNQEGIQKLQFDWEGRILVEGTVKWLHLESSPDPQENGEIFWHGIVADITEQKLAEEEHHRLQKLFFHAQKLESLGVLAGGIAHDFNNILMAILGNAGLALMRIDEKSPVLENLNRIEQAAARAADLTKQMLAYSGKGKFVVENLDLNLLIEKMPALLELSISKKAELRLNLHQHLPPVEADATQLHQIIMNLVINASEALEGNCGVINITTGCMDCDRNYLKDVWLDGSVNEGLYVYMEITDNGCGMDKETMAKLFDPFFTTKFTGRGLGMAAVLGIVKGHKGAIRVYSELGKGTAFKVLLPASDQQVDVSNHDSHTDDWQGSGTILLVDDDATVRSIGVELLKVLGFTPITADDGFEAISIYKKTPGIAFVILDLTMPRMDGEQCFHELRQLDPEVKVIMSSGYNEQEVTQKFVGDGLSGFIQKPYKLSVLRDEIKRVVKLRMENC